MLTHYYQQRAINGIWFLISVVGMYYMFRVMPMRVRQMQKIFAAWLVPIVFGMAVSGLVFYIPQWRGLIGYLGAFWLLIMAAGYFLNGLVDEPAFWYYFAAAINFVAGAVLLLDSSLLSVQYLIAAIISAWSMLNLWLFRS